MWTPEAVSTASCALEFDANVSHQDELLLKAVAEHGKVWTKIVKTYFSGRTGLSAKNRLVELPTASLLSLTTSSLVIIALLGLTLTTQEGGPGEKVPKALVNWRIESQQPLLPPHLSHPRHPRHVAAHPRLSHHQCQYRLQSTRPTNRVYLNHSPAGHHHP